MGVAELFSNVSFLGTVAGVFSGILNASQGGVNYFQSV